METVIIDVRTAKEFSEAALPGAVNIPSNTFLTEHFQPYQDNHICLVCESGDRARVIQKKLNDSGFQNVSVLWQHMEELNTATTSSIGWSLDRQFRLALALLVGSFLLGYEMNIKAFFIVPVILFSGLLFSVVTDNCYLKELIVKLPWNRRIQHG